MDGADMVYIRAGRFRMGSAHFYPEEGPVRQVEVDAFAIQRGPVTVAQFARFTEETGYVTVAERPPALADDQPAHRTRRRTPARVTVMIGTVPDRLYFTDSDEANALIASDPMALLVGFALDQQVTVQKAFAGPLALRERLGALDADTLASADLESVFRPPPAIHRFPASMARRVHDLAVYVRDHYDGDAARIWTGAPDGDTLRSNLLALPGFGEMKIKALGAVLAKRFGVAAAQDLVPWHPTLGDVDSPQALADYQAAKRAHKAQWSKAQGAR